MLISADYMLDKQSKTYYNINCGGDTGLLATGILQDATDRSGSDGGWGYLGNPNANWASNVYQESIRSASTI